MQVKRTYSSRDRSARPCITIVPLSTASSSLPSSTLSSPSKRKRPLGEQLSLNIGSPPMKRPKTLKPFQAQAAKKTKQKNSQKSLTQLHFCIDQTILRTCSACNLSYTIGAPDDEALHRVHCGRVQKGMEWGREEEKEKFKAGIVEAANGVKLKDGRKGRIICFPADIGGKIGSKLTLLLQTVNLALSSPPLTPAILQVSKAYLFLLPQTSAASREKIIGCIIAQRISTAMDIVQSNVGMDSSLSLSEPCSKMFRGESAGAAIDIGSGLFCHPELMPTPMGISRLFVPSTHRRQGVASKLLSAAAETFIHGCPLDPRKCQVAFTQPTGNGTAVMRAWGGDRMRIYEE